MFVHTSNGSRMASSSRRGFTLIELLVVLCVIVVLIGIFLPSVNRGREPARRAQCRNNLKQIGLALHNYHDAWGTFPPAYTVGADGKRLHSWRTLLLPYLDQQALYARIDLSKAWDDPVNLEAFKASAPVYHCPSLLAPNDKTTYLAVVTPHSVLRAGSSCRIRDITDGTSNTLVVIESRAEHAVPWMAPQDANESVVSALRTAKSKHNHVGGGHALLTEGAVRFISENIEVTTLLGLTTVAGGEKVGDF